MEWAKIPTDLLIDGLKDWELSGLIKYTLLWAQKEYEPNKETCLRVMSKRQYDFVQTFHDSIEANIKNSLRIMNNKRTADKVRYKKNKDFHKDSDSGKLTDIKWLASNEDIKKTMGIKQATEDLKDLKRRGVLPKIPVIDIQPKEA